MSLAIALDLLVAGLLVATIGYAVVLNNRLRQLRSGRAEMERLINEFYQATTRAESGVSALKEVAALGDTEIGGQLESLTKLRDELETLVARAEVQSARLQETANLSVAPSPTPGPRKATTGLPPDDGLDAELFANPDSGASGATRRRASHDFARPKSAMAQGMR